MFHFKHEFINLIDKSLDISGQLDGVSCVLAHINLLHSSAEKPT